MDLAKIAVGITSKYKSNGRDAQGNRLYDPANQDLISILDKLEEEYGVKNPLKVQSEREEFLRESLFDPNRTPPLEDLGLEQILLDYYSTNGIAEEYRGLSHSIRDISSRWEKVNIISGYVDIVYRGIKRSSSVKDTIEELKEKRREFQRYKQGYRLGLREQPKALSIQKYSDRTNRLISLNKGAIIFPATMGVGFMHGILDSQGVESSALSEFALKYLPSISYGLLSSATISSYSKDLARTTLGYNMDDPEQRSQSNNWETNIVDIHKGLTISLGVLTAVMGGVYNLFGYTAGRLIGKTF